MRRLRCCSRRTTAGSTACVGRWDRRPRPETLGRSGERLGSSRDRRATHARPPHGERKALSMRTLRTRSIGTKVTDQEYAEIEPLADGQKMSEWVRTVLLDE